MAAKVAAADRVNAEGGIVDETTAEKANILDYRVD